MPDSGKREQCNLLDLDDFCAQHPDIPEIGNMTMTRLRLNEGVGSDTVGTDLAIEGSESLYRAPQGAEIPEEREKNQRSDPRERLGRYLGWRDVDLHLPLRDQNIHRG